MDVARLNFSHGEHADHEENYIRVRAASDATGKAVGVLADLQGPKIRLGRFKDERTTWANGEEVRITVDDVEGTHDRVGTTYKELARDAKPAIDCWSTTERSAWSSRPSTATTSSVGSPKAVRSATTRASHCPV